MFGHVRSLLLQEPCLIIFLFFFFFLHKWGHIFPAEPASACKSLATKREGVEQEKKDAIQVSPSLHGARTSGGTNIWTGTPETSPESGPPQVKRVKREAVKEEVEEGEIIDSSEEEGNADDNTPCATSCDGARSPANDMEVIKDEPTDRVDVNVDDGINKPSGSSRDQGINENNSGSLMTIELSEKSAEVSMTKDAAVKEPGPVHTHHCHDENESANAADSCGPE